MLLETFLAAQCTMLSTKMIYTSTEKNKKIEKDILEQGLYHVTTQKAADAILEAGYIKPSNSLISLGSKKCFFFAGTPDYQTLIQNVANIGDYEMTAIKVKPSQEQLKSYKVRSYNDNAVIYKGKCTLENRQVEKVALVIDIDEKGALYTREKTKEEIEKGAYEPKEAVKQKLHMQSMPVQMLENMGKSYIHEYKTLWNQIKGIARKLFRKEDVKLLEAPKQENENANPYEQFRTQVSQNGELQGIDERRPLESQNNRQVEKVEIKEAEQDQR